MHSAFSLWEKRCILQKLHWLPLSRVLGICMHVLPCYEWFWPFQPLNAAGRLRAERFAHLHIPAYRVSDNTIMPDAYLLQVNHCYFRNTYKPEGVFN